MKIERQELNVLDFGVDNTGKTDVTERLTELHNTGARIYYPNGTYRFNGATLNFEGGVRFESPNGVIIRNDISELPIVNFDKYGNFVGLQQNHLEAEDTNTPVSGSLVSPPLFDEDIKTKVDFMPYWYNDFGRKSQILRITGWVGWHYWTWNHHPHEGSAAKTPCDEQRHPLLGWYYGDNPVTLDWQCYWMLKAGTKAVALLTGDVSQWEEEYSGDHWIYQLFHNVPNFKKMKFCAFFGYWSKDKEALWEHWKQIADRLYFRNRDQIYMVNHGGKQYPLVQMWDMKILRENIDPDGGVENCKDLMLRLGNLFKEKGFEGVCFFSRECCRGAEELNSPANRAELEAAGVIHYDAYYEVGPFYNKEMPLTTYTELVDAFDPHMNPYQILNVTTGCHTRPPHPSGWVRPGQNPKDFGRLVKKAVDYLEQHPELQKIITCYNVAEWAEGGPGFQPNMLDGFGFLDACADAIIVK